MASGQSYVGMGASLRNEPKHFPILFFSPEALHSRDRAAHFCRIERKWNVDAQVSLSVYPLSKSISLDAMRCRKSADIIEDLETLSLDSIVAVYRQIDSAEDQCRYIPILDKAICILKAHIFFKGSRPPSTNKGKLGLS